MLVKSPEAKRLHVLEACAPVFGAHGYSRTTMGDLARAAGMSRPALYLVFPRKEQLFSSLLREAAGSPSFGRGYAHLVEWLLWACALWTGERGQSAAPAEGACSQSEKYSEYMLIESLLREGIEARLPVDDLGVSAADVARLIATSMRGLTEIPLEKAERQRLLKMQVRSIALASGWFGPSFAAPAVSLLS